MTIKTDHGKSRAEMPCFFFAEAGMQYEYFCNAFLKDQGGVQADDSV